MVIVLINTIILGGGLAGLSTALHINKGKTLILEKKKQTGQPVLCAEGIGSHVLKQLNIKPETEYVANTIQKIRITFPNNKTKTIQLKHLKGYILHRDKFEQYLARECIKKGVTIRNNAKFLKYDQKQRHVIYDYGGIQYITKTNIVVDATGIQACVGKNIGMNLKLKKEDICTCIQKTIQDNNINDDVIQLYLGKQIAPGGYAWVFPKGNHIANVGLGITKNQNRLQYYMQNLLNYLSLKPEKTLKEFRSCVPLSMPAEHIVKNNVLLVGDAARFVNAATGAGIGYSYKSGQIAGECITQYNNGWSKTLQNYEEIMKQTLYPRLIHAYRMKQKLTHNENTMNRLYYKFLPIIMLHRVFPFIEKYALKRFRY